MRARLREGFAQFFAKLKDHALEWAVTAALVTVIPPMLAIEEQFVAWFNSLFPPTWWYRAFLVLIVVMWWRWIRWEWNRPRLRPHPESGTYIDIKTGTHYCTKCRKEGHPVALRESKTAWRCFGCDSFYPKLRGSSD